MNFCLTCRNKFLKAGSEDSRTTRRVREETLKLRRAAYRLELNCQNITNFYSQYICPLRLSPYSLFMKNMERTKNEHFNIEIIKCICILTFAQVCKSNFSHLLKCMCNLNSTLSAWLCLS